MNALNLTDGDITHRKEILQLLEMALAQKWQFSYVKKAKNRVASHALQLVSVNAQDGTLSVSSESPGTQISSPGSLTIRAQSGGVSIIFQSRLAEITGDATATKMSSLQHFELPYKVACTQLRKTVRVNLESITVVPVILYMVNGALIEGSVMDISTSGAKFRVNQDLGQELKNLQVVDACKITLPNGLALQTGVQLIGMINDEDSNISFLRCEFVHMRSQDEEKLDNFIHDMLQQVESANEPLAD
ncbi:MAG: PilZ domain-containing protein [Proteobacteria bacterium]|nr:PilZ domain-containing protein [Pseudomonadota bacterium]